MTSVFQVVTGGELILVGLALRAWAAHSLRHEAGFDTKEWMKVQWPPKGYAVGGPYKFLRHPMYVGSLMFLSGVGLLCLGWGGLALALPAVPFFAARMVNEDEARKNYLKWNTRPVFARTLAEWDEEEWRDDSNGASN